MRSKRRALLILVRPLNVLIAVASIAVGALTAGTLEPVGHLALALLSGALVMAGGNVLNDYYDLEVDRRNKAYRPLPAGDVSRPLALKFSIILFLLGNFVTIFLSLSAFCLVLFVTLGLILYNARLKRTVLLGNVAVSLFGGLAFLYGGLVVGRPLPALIPAGFAFFFHLGREVIKDIEDRDADGAASLRTLPVRFGVKPALAIATLVFAILIFGTFLPYVWEIYGAAYLWTVVIGVDLVVAASLLYLWRHPEPQAMRRVSAILKADMVLGLAAILLGTMSFT